MVLHTSTVSWSSLFGDDVYDTGHGLAILGVEAAADHRHLGDGVGLYVHASLLINGVVGDHPIHHIDHLVVTAAADVQAAGIPSPRLHRAGLVGHHVREGGYRHLVDLTPADELGTGGNGSIHHGPFGDDHHLFDDVQLGFPQGEIDGRGHVCRDPDILYLQGGIPHHRGRHDIGAHRHVDDEILALQVAGRAHSAALDDNVHPGQGNAGAFIVHPTGKFPGDAGRSDSGDDPGQTHHEAYDTQTFTFEHTSSLLSLRLWRRKLPQKTAALLPLTLCYGNIEPPQP